MPNGDSIHDDLLVLASKNNKIRYYIRREKINNKPIARFIQKDNNTEEITEEISKNEVIDKIFNGYFKKYYCALSREKILQLLMDPYK